MCKPTTHTILGFSFKENVPDIRNTKIIQIIRELKKYPTQVRVFDEIVSKKEVKKRYGINIYDFRDLKKFKYDAIILAVSHKIFLKKINFYDKFYKNKKNKVFIDIKNNYSRHQLEKDNFKYFQL